MAIRKRPDEIDSEGVEGFERRYFPALDVELRAAADGEAKPNTLVGHAALFNSFSEDLGGFREVIAPGAFTKAIGRDDVRALFNHDSNFVLGRNKSKTLRLSEDEKGLAVEIDLPDSQTIRDLVLTPIARRDITQMSFGFITEDDSWEKKEGDAFWTRTLHAVRLFDVSPVTFPAYRKTDIGVAKRSLDRYLASDSSNSESQNFTAEHRAELERLRLRLLLC